LARCYRRNGVWGWSLQDQLEALRQASVLEMDKLYTDELTAERAKRPAQVHPEWLVERANLLKPTNRRGGETIAVATLLALGTGEVDLVHAIALAFGRRATIHAVDSGLVIKPDDGAAGVNAAMADWLRAKRSAQTKPGRRLGNASAAEKAKARSLAKLPEARPLWGLPTEEISTVEIAKRTDLSVKTLYAYLGRREVAQYAAKRRAKRKGARQ
jgi:hypothetical protein